MTFDDALLSRVDIALPVLEDYSLKAIFSVYSSVFSGSPDSLEIYADFRATMFGDFSLFWKTFRRVSMDLFPDMTLRLRDEFPQDYLGEFPFYTVQEREFRFLRDNLLGPGPYETVIEQMIGNSSYDMSDRARAMWMSREDLLKISEGNHTIALHSHNHPIRISRLSRVQQEEEYRLNFDWISSEIGVSPTVVAHPCGDYSEETLEILIDLGVEIGFRSSFTEGRYSSKLEIPRKGHAVLMLEIDNR